MTLWWALLPTLIQKIILRNRWASLYYLENMQYYVGGSSYWWSLHNHKHHSRIDGSIQFPLQLWQGRSSLWGDFICRCRHFLLFKFDNQCFFQIPPKCSFKHQSESLLRQLRKWAKWDPVRRNMAGLPGIGPIRRRYFLLLTNQRLLLSTFD